LRSTRASGKSDRNKLTTEAIFPASITFVARSAAFNDSAAPYPEDSF
jgi:hypothetical protein